VQELCTQELKDRLQPMRDRYKLHDDAEQEALRRAKQQDPQSQPAAAGSSKGLPKVLEPTSFGEDPGSNNSGLYELKAVITHKGRSSNSGHYVAWVRVGRGK
jgi:ubiquitin carboxyl-terminal hydrolase 14